MAKQAKSDKVTKSGFVIKLSSETALKLAEEDQQAKQSISESQENLPTTEIKEKNDEKLNQRSASKNEESRPENVTKMDTKAVDEKDSTEDLKAAKIASTDNKPDEQTASAGSTQSSWGDYAPYITYEGEEAIYTDPSTHQQYTWNKTTNAWDPKGGEVPGRVYSYENDTHIYTDADGSKSFWDEEKKAWLPKVDDDFLALYQMSYGFVDNAAKEPEQKKSKEEIKAEKAEAGVKRKNDPQWFEPDDVTNTKVYVSNLPSELTEEEFVDFMQKCGLVMRDPANQKMKVKLYMDKEQNCFKGDALCTYIKIESVELALNLLDGSDFKGNKIKVERAHFQLKGEYNPALKPKKKKKKELEKLKKQQEKLFDWRPEKFIGERAKHEKVVIIKNLFHPTDFDKDVQLILDYQQDMREECTKCGEVRKVVIYDRHPEGVAQVSMKEPEQADAVVALINGRWFGKRQITAEIWDGRTKYRIAETDADLSKRKEGWEKFLDGEDKDGKKADKSSSEKTVTTESSQDSGDKTVMDADNGDKPVIEADNGDKPVIKADNAEASVKSE